MKGTITILTATILAIMAVSIGSPNHAYADDADLIVLVGDIDNLGFGFPDGFDIFSGATTPRHSFPFQPEIDDPPGTDRIMVGTSYEGSLDSFLVSLFFPV